MDFCVQGSICFEMIKGVPAAFVTLIVGSIAGAITFRQYQVAKAKLKLDLFDKRYAIFTKAWSAISDAASIRASSRLTVPKDDDESITPFSLLLPEVVFLFGKEIEDYLNELSKHFTELHRGAKHLPISAEDDAQNKARVQANLTYFIEQIRQGAKARFGVYLSFENWK